MSERNARLVRKYMKVLGPERLPETLDVRGKQVRNPILEDWEYIFTHGTSKQRGILANWIRKGILLEDPLALNKRANREVLRDS